MIASNADQLGDDRRNVHVRVHGRALGAGWAAEQLQAGPSHSR
jgi:hypothetical protein